MQVGDGDRDGNGETEMAGETVLGEAQAIYLLGGMHVAVGVRGGGGAGARRLLLRIRVL